MRWWVPGCVSLFVVAGCGVTARGLIGPGVEGPELAAIDGRTVRLLPANERAALLRFLDGEDIEVEGRRSPAGIRVRDWTLHAGTHGLQPFLGRLTQSPYGVGLLDETSKAFVVIDDKAANQLASYLGEVVLLEGYVEGAQAVRVVYYRVLAEPEDVP